MRKRDMPSPDSADATARFVYQSQRARQSPAASRSIEIEKSIIRRLALRELKSMWVTVAPPINGDLDAVVEAFWFVEGDVLSLCDEAGRATGQTERLTVGGSDRAVASRLRKREWAAETGESAFSPPLNYSRHGVA